MQEIWDICQVHSMKGSAQIKHESESKWFSVTLSLAGSQVSRTIPYTSPEGAGPEPCHRASDAQFAGNTGQKALRRLQDRSLLHGVQHHHECYHEIHSVLAYSQRKTPTRLRIRNATDWKQQPEATAPLWLPQIHTKHTGRKECCVSQVSCQDILAWNTVCHWKI